jgi:MarR family transcriptional regulator for hemolysin
MPPPAQAPLGLHLTRVARTVSRAFDAALAEAGGSLSSWLILIALKSRSLASQRELAEAVGIRGATLTHHLDSMEAAGLVRRRRDAANRRIQHVELTEGGAAAFQRMRRAAVAFDQRLRRGLSDEETAALGTALDRLHGNVTEV